MLGYGGVAICRVKASGFVWTVVYHSISDTREGSVGQPSHDLLKRSTLKGIVRVLMEYYFATLSLLGPASPTLLYNQTSFLKRTLV